MEISVPLSRSKITESVSKITGFTARSIEGGIDRVSVTSDESPITDDLYNRALNSLLSTLSAYKPSYTDPNISLLVPSIFDNNSVGALEEEFNNYIVNYICAEWFAIAREKEDEERYKSNRDYNSINILTLLSRRLKPVER